MTLWVSKLPSANMLQAVDRLMEPSFAGPLPGSAQLGMACWFTPKKLEEVVNAYLAPDAPIPLGANVKRLTADVLVVEGRFAKTGIFLSSHSKGSAYILTKGPSVVVEGSAGAPSGESFAQVAVSGPMLIAEVSLQSRLWTFLISPNATEGEEENSPDSGERTGGELGVGQLGVGRLASGQLTLAEGPIARALSRESAHHEPLFRSHVNLTLEEDGRIIALLPAGHKIRRAEFVPTVQHFFNFLIAKGVLGGTVECDLTHHKGSHPSRPTLTASGFEPNESCEILFDGTVLTRVRANSNGEVRRAIVIPKSAQPGRYIISIFGKRSNRKSETNFTVLSQR